MRKSLMLCLSFLILLPVIACDDDPKGNNNSNLTKEQFLAEVADRYPETYCDFIARCPQPDGEEWMVDREACMAVLGTVFLTEGLMEMEWALDNGATHSGANLDACMDAVEDLGCTDDLDAIEACNQVVVGTLEDGAECSSNFQCASGFCNTEEVCPGTCDARLPLGSPCADGGECEYGLQCDWENDECIEPPAPAAQGEACEWHDDCEYGLYCLVTDFETYVGACQPWLGEGDVCDGDGAMDNLCEPGLACDPESGECAQVTVAGIGQTCNGETIQCDISEHAICIPQSETLYQCIELPGTGEACLDGECWPGNYCDAEDLCRVAKEIGENCADHDECVTEYCDGTCIYDPCGYDEEEPI